MIRRKIQIELELLAREYNVVTITGPRQSSTRTEGGYFAIDGRTDRDPPTVAAFDGRTPGSRD